MIFTNFANIIRPNDMKNIILFILSFFLFLSYDASADEVMRYRRYTTADGLLQTNATTFAQDKDGYIWIGTRSGLYRFDGVRFEHFNITDEGKKIGWIRKIRIDKDGHSLVMKINNQKFVHFDPLTRRMTELKGSINLGDQAPTKDILDYTPEGLLMHHNGKEFRISYSGNTLSEIFHCENFIDRQGNLWANFDNAVHQISFSSTNYNIYNDMGDSGRTPFVADVRCITRLSDGTMLVGTKGREIIHYGRNGEYLGCLNKGGQWQTEHTEFVETAYNIQEDMQGRLWVGMRTNGLACIDKPFTKAQRLFLYQRKDSPWLPSDKIFDIRISKKTGWLWIGTWGNGFAAIDTRKKDLNLEDVQKAVVRTDRPELLQVRRICEMDDRIVLCTTSGLYVYDQKGHLLSHNGDIDFSGVVRVGNTMYVGAYSQGAFVIDGNGELRQIEIPELGDCIHSVTAYRDGQVLFVNPDRIVLYDPHRGSTRYFDNMYFGTNVSFSEGQPLILQNTLYAGMGTGMLKLLLTPQKGAYVPTIHIPQAGMTVGMGEQLNIRPVVMDYRLPRMVSYAWREKGDSVWHYLPAGRDEVQLSWFMPGVHKVEFCSTDAMGIWAENVTEVDFYVFPSWWQWIIIVLVLGMIAVIVVLLYKVTHPKLIVTSDTTVETATDIFPSTPDVTPYDKELAQKLVDNIEREMSNPDYDVEQLATDMGMSRSQLYAHCKDTLDKTPAAFILEIRMKRAMQLIETRQLRVSEVAYKVGFTDPKYFAKVFKKRVGVSPTQYSAKG